MRIATQIQNAARRRDRAACRKTVIPTGEQQRTVIQHRPACVRVRPAQSQRRSSVLHQALRASQDSAHRSALRRKSRSRRCERSVLNHAARKRDRSQRRLAIAAKVQNATRRGDRAAHRKTIIPTGEQQRTVIQSGSTCVRVHPAQRQCRSSVLHQALRASENRVHRPALRRKSRSPRCERSVLNHAARKCDRSQRRLTIAAEVQNATRCRDRAAS